MDRVLQELRWSRCLVYLYDIISFGTTLLDALDKLTLIFERLRAYGLQLKSTKRHLFQTSVPFLGHIVGRSGLECNPKKIEDVKSWPVPDCLKSVSQFLGFVGYYRRFIPNFADLAPPPPPGGINWQGRPIRVGTGLFKLIIQSAQFSHSGPDTGLSYGD